MQFLDETLFNLLFRMFLGGRIIGADELDLQLYSSINGAVRLNLAYIGINEHEKKLRT